MKLYQRFCFERFKSILIPFTHCLGRRVTLCHHSEKIACAYALTSISAFGTNLPYASFLKSCVEK